MNRIFRKTRMMILTVLTVLLAFASTVQAEETAVPQSMQQMQLSFAPLVKKTSPAVVNIYAKRVVKEQMRMISPFFNDPFFGQFFNMPGFGGGVRERVENSLGSGVIVDPSGVIATNTHVIKGASEITVVTSDSREFTAKKLLVDEKTDLAILKVDAKDEKLPHLMLADSDALEVGDLVLAIGNPFGVGQTVTSGIVSGLARTGVGASDYSYFIQTDAAINPGNSGGALVDMKGRLVGINSMIFSKDGGSLGIGFAIPANMVATVIDASKTGGKIVRPWSGMTGQPITPDMIEGLGLKHAHGTLINKVSKGGPADDAGIKAGDAILTIDGKEIQHPEALKFRLATAGIGKPVKLTVLRDGKTFDAVMVTTAPPENPPRDETLLKGANPISGAVVVNISPAVSEELGGVDAENGVLVMKAEQGNAARLGLSQGDIIVSINGIDIKTVDQLDALLKSAKNRRWQIELMRGGKVISVMVTI